MTHRLQENVPLAPLTTFGVGGKARFFIEAHTDAEINEAIQEAQSLKLTLFPLGAGSNILVPDEGVTGAVMRIMTCGITCEDKNNELLIIADAGAPWEKIVDAASAHNVFGIENLAGIPGTAGGAAVQNIGAYGAELADVFAYADVIDRATGVLGRISQDEAQFEYRESFFKKNRELIVLRIALRLAKNTLPNLQYPDVARLQKEGVSLSTPSEIARAVRAVRADKFPSLTKEGTAGSFFKNPVIPRGLSSALEARFPGLPLFPQKNGMVKVPLAWILDHILSLKGYREGPVRLYEKQPLVIVAEAEATAKEIDAFARDITERVFSATGIAVEYEVEMFGREK